MTEGHQRDRTGSEHTRRDFLHWLSVAPGAAVIGSAALGAACSDEVIGGDSDSSTADTGLSDGGPDLQVTGDGGGDLTVETGEAVCELTGSDAEGPFFVEGAPRRAVLAAEDEPGDRLTIRGTVYGPDCRTPLPGALLDVWQADAEGNYHTADQEYRLRGQVLTDEQGGFELQTIKPGHYPQGGSFRPAHIHFTVSAPGHTTLTTQMYFAGDPYLSPADPCTGCSSEDPTLIIPLAEAAGGSSEGTFEIVLDRVSA